MKTKYVLLTMLMAFGSVNGLDEGQGTVKQNEQTSKIERENATEDVTAKDAVIGNAVSSTKIDDYTSQMMYDSEDSTNFIDLMASGEINRI